MQSWSGLFLLGVMLQDKDMTAAGAMGWSIEETATEEYWFDYYGWKDGPASANFPPTSSSMPSQPTLMMEAIVMAPLRRAASFSSMASSGCRCSRGSITLRCRDPKFSQHELDSMLQDEQPMHPGFNISSLGADWERLDAGLRPVFRSGIGRHADGHLLGRQRSNRAEHQHESGTDLLLCARGPAAWAWVAWGYHADLPASLIYQKPGDKNLTVVAWNETGGSSRDLPRLPWRPGCRTGHRPEPSTQRAASGTDGALSVWAVPSFFGPSSLSCSWEPEPRYFPPRSWSKLYEYHPNNRPTLRFQFRGYKIKLNFS